MNKRIKNLRLEHDLTQREFADKLGVSIITIQGWESGTRHPSAKALISIAELFDVTSDYILGISSEGLISKEESELINNYRTLDSFGRQAVNSVCSIEADRAKTCESKPRIIKYIKRFLAPAAAGYAVPIEGSDYDLIPITDSALEPADYAVVIQGESMMPYIHDGETVFVKKTADITSGDIGIFSVNGSMYCKQYHSYEGTTSLLSLNPDWSESNVVIPPGTSDDVRCMGKVISKTAPFPKSYEFECKINSAIKELF